MKVISIDNVYSFVATHTAQSMSNEKDINKAHKWKKKKVIKNDNKVFWFGSVFYTQFGV